MLKENIPPISVLKRSNQELSHSQNPKRQKRPGVRFVEVTSLGAPLKDCADDTTETIGFPHVEVERLRHLEGKSLVIYSDEIRETDDSPTMKVFYHSYAEDRQIQRRLTEKLERQSKTIRNDETWEWGFNVLSRYWRIETEAHPKNEFSTQDIFILRGIDTALLSLLGNVEEEQNFEDLYPNLYNDALDDYIDASTAPDQSKKFPNNRKRFTISHKVFAIFGITKKTYGSPQPETDIRQFSELYDYLYNEKIDSFEKRYTARSEQAKIIAARHFLPRLELDEDERESESIVDNASDAALNANAKLTLSLATFATANNLNLTEIVTDGNTRTTEETRRLLLIALKMYLLRPISWEEKAYFNRFEPGFFSEKSDEDREKNI